MNIPQPAVAQECREMHFIWLIDSAGSMAKHGKIQAVNRAINETLPAISAFFADSPEIQVMMGAITFSDGARWHLSPARLEDFRWQDVSAAGVRDMGRAFRLVAEFLGTLDSRGMPLVLVLISDGYATDDVSDGLRALLDQPWGKKAVRLSVAIGDEADLDVLQRFMSHPERSPLRADNAEQLGQQLKSAFDLSQRNENPGIGQMIPVPLPPPDPDNSESFLF